MSNGERRDRKGARGFDFTRHIRVVCEDMVNRLPELGHIDMSLVAISLSQARKGGPYGIYASLTPMRFEGGAMAGKQRGRYYKSQSLLADGGQEMLYILTFYLPRFTDVDLREKLITIVHELWHISPHFDGDLRRHEGRCYAHSDSKANYDHQMGRIVDRYLAMEPPTSLYGFLNFSFVDLQRIHGRVYGLRYSRPKLLPVSAAEAHQMNRELKPRQAS